MARTPPRARRMIGRRGTVGAALICLLAVTAAAAPLALYATSLALFGLPHVLAELRYVDVRFRPRIGRVLLLAVLALLGALVAGRMASLARLPWPRNGAVFELLILGALAAVTIPVLVRASRVGALAALVVAAAAGFGAATDPLATVVVLSLAHNLTPIGFLAERLRGPTRTAAMWACAIAFVAVPLVIFSGVLEALPGLDALARLNITAWTGDTINHMAVFVPRDYLDEAWAPRLFAVAAYLQCVHYAVVLGVLPRLLPDDQRAPVTLVPWPRPTVFGRVLVAAGVLGSVTFAASFVGARATYAVAAAVHAFVEFPLLLLACAPAGRLAATAAA